MNVPLPDEVPISLALLQELAGAIERALQALEPLVGREATVIRDLDDALGSLSRRILRQIGLLDDED